MAVTISRQMLEEMFDRMAGEYNWNVDAPLLWGYFFTAQDRGSLETLAAALLKDGYDVVDIYQSEPDRLPAAGLWWLHVERTEWHDVVTLLERNEQLGALAARFNIESYDGMDVGPARLGLH